MFLIKRTQKKTFGFTIRIESDHNKVLVYISTLLVQLILQGKVEMTIELLTKEEAEVKPAGKARDEPNQNPTLDPPK